ncbi:MAG: hypothetical protein HOH43_19980 [Candidatus Latescibacteria bacterium]|nr:hypothetical protein [Candidatus Latescibacterota bacterium]
MSAIFASIHWQGKPVDPSVLDSAIGCVRHRCPDGAWKWMDGAVGLAQADLATLPEDEPGSPVVSGALRIVASCRIDNREEVLGILGSRSPVNGTDTALILAAYEAFGEACAEKLIGDFAFAIWNTKTRTLFAARDPSGVRPLFYYSDRERLLVASDRTQIFQDPAIPCEVDEDQFLSQLTTTFLSRSGWDQGYFRNLNVLPAGSAMRAADGEMSIRQYWFWETSGREKLSEDEVVESYLSTLKESVRCRLRSRQKNVGMELSGGLDSTSVVSVAGPISEALGLSIHTLSDVFEKAKNVDERPCIQAVLDRNPKMTPHFLTADGMYAPQCLDSDWYPRQIMGPLEISIPPAIHGLYDIAEEAGCRSVLTGRYGNEVNNGNYLVYYDLMRRFRVGEALRRFKVDRARYGRRAWRSFLKYGLLPLAAPMSWINSGVLSQKRRAAAILDLPSYITSSVQRRIQDMDHVILAEEINGNQLRSSPLRETVAGLTSPNLTVLTQYAQPVEPRHPYLDRRLIQASLSMPQDMKWNHDESDPHLANRSHHRKALRGILPERVRVKNRGVEFSSAIEDSVCPETVRRWFTEAPVVHIFERGYVVPKTFYDSLQRTDNYMSTMYLSFIICLEGWLRAMEVGGAFNRLVRSS